MLHQHLICEFELPIGVTPRIRIIDGPKYKLLSDYQGIKQDIEQRLVRVWNTEIDPMLQLSIQKHYKSMKKISCSCLILNTLIFSVFIIFIETILTNQDIIIQYGMYIFAICWIIQSVLLACYIFHKMARLIDKKSKWHDQFIAKMNEYVYKTLKIDYSYWTFSTTQAQHIFYIRMTDTPIFDGNHSENSGINVTRSSQGAYTPLLNSISEQGAINS